ncbi:MAG: carboxypeptidase-like regulatory domain-containing protein [Bacteroidetes bacterium]|nr:MAG: carboxypeptidase-like regulatory domain-containing protein [Bacteroidota bacterium]
MNRQSRLILVSILLSIACCLLPFTSIFAQKKPAYVSGKVLDENENPLSNVSVVILGQQKGIITSDSGTFRLKVTPDRAFALVFSYTGFKPQQKNFLLNENEEETIDFGFGFINPASLLSR